MSRTEGGRKRAAAARNFAGSEVIEVKKQCMRKGRNEASGIAWDLDVVVYPARTFKDDGSAGGAPAGLPASCRRYGRVPGGLA